MRNLNKKHIKTKILSLLLVLMNSIWSGNVAFAQFYDDEDEILFYQCVLLNGKVNPSTNNYSYVFNFDGDKATTLGTSTPYIKSDLKKNNNYYEGKVFDAKFDVKYRSDLSSESWVVYSRYRTGGNNSFSFSFTEYWYFSRDRKTMIYKDSKNEWTYKLVDKSYYVEEGRRRSNLNNEVIYE